MISFKNDYSEGAYPQILEAMVRTNMEQTDGYGFDPHTANAERMIKEKLNCQDCWVHLMVGGTITNLTMISKILRPYEAVIAAETGHICTHEAGAIEATGHKAITVPTNNGKITGKDILKVLEDHLDFHMVLPKMVYISNPTEIGTLYSKAELTELYKVCQKNGLYLYLDGARMAAALTAQGNDLTLEDYANLTDAFYIGGTKCGALFGEALVIMRKELNQCMMYHRKQKGSVLAKGRLLGIQFEELFRDDLYLKAGETSNKTALRIRNAIAEEGFSFLIDSVTNQQFPILPIALLEELGKKYKYTFWEHYDLNHDVIRLVTCWATTDEQVDTFIRDFKEMAKNCKVK